MMNRIFKIVSLTVVMLAVLALPVYAVYDFVPEAHSLVTGSMTDFIVAGTTGYAIDAYGVKSFDLTNPAAPVEWSSFPTNGGAMAAVKIGNNLCIADGNKGLTIVNVVDPMNMTLVSNLNLGGSCRSIAASGNTVYCTIEGIGMKVISVANPLTPIVLSTLALPADAYTIRYDQYAFLACGDAGLVIVNVTSPTAPVILSTTGTPGTAYGVAVNFPYVVVADGPLGVNVFDATTPAAPINLNSFMTAGEAVHASFNTDGSYVVISELGDGIQFMDGTNWAILGSYATVGSAYETKTSGNYAYVAEGVKGFEVVDFTTVSNPTQFGHYWEMGGPRATYKFNDQFAVVANYSDGMWVVNLETIAVPLPVANVPSTFWCYDVTGNGNYVYTADWSGAVKVVDLTIPSSPNVVGTWTDDTTGGRSIAYYNSYVYVGTYFRGVRIVNVTTPSSPSLAGTLPIAAACKGVTVAGSRLYVAASELGVRIYDLTTPATPTFLGTAATVGNARMSAVNGNTLFVAAEQAGVKIFDVTNAASPLLLSTISFEGLGDDARGVTYFNGKLYVAHTSTGIMCFDVSNPSAPVGYGNEDTPGLAYEVTGWNNDYVLVNDTYSLEVLRQDEVGVKPETPVNPNNFTFAGNFPNPFNAATTLHFTLPQSGQVTVAIFDASGRLATVPFSGAMQQGEHRLNVNMEQFSSGVYLVKVVTPTGQATHSMVLLK
ncbi:MAG: T9SS type A sorting domain-containing protein [bacterium]|nr:T9SS type A sorting domain-containing protein [bacterium]